ncbi:hypothetical protein NDA11_001884 [Ustilago hordei]|uniref:Related to Chitin-binding protein n=1 Tax=Ustilago hordei TaxID=120017 RepID=I2FTJ1_USTHO|nr:uncharacterized protein UHO2_06265 [Ustilago hordei]KAJ1037719.1 hypothetical protein NDA10_004711 [Ustilago hordei]KAJ1574924.1 hypothetical protein NDA15_001574 [Ustilago hordei]KAJ1594032.1 hypothetical protein NDA12_003500 [Ustilago hordei]KAJ1594705.1 hypothetical protein NDA11_001884 [Ustilago hordei]KAJ1597654.1 hypothetical protein NDA14_007398 [Ustilago hordei]
MAFGNLSWSLSFFQLVALVATLCHLFIGLVDAHGYVMAPASRSYACSQGTAKDCGAIQYEPQSVEAPKGLPFNRNGDAHLCSAGLSQFSELDRQGAKVWPTSKASDVHSFTWKFTAQHSTTDFKYFITKANWDATKTQGLTASDFESTPFLTIPMNGKSPPVTMKHDLQKNLPSRSGYHVVYAVWTIDNTANAFYQCVDLDFGGKSSDGSTAPSTSSSLPSRNSSSSAPTGTAASDSGSSAPANSGSSSGANSSASNQSHKAHTAKLTACRMKRRQAPSGSLFAARGDYRRQKLQLQRKRQI